MDKNKTLKIITLSDENKEILNEANRRIANIRRSKWKTTPALENAIPGLKKFGTKARKFSVAARQPAGQVGAALAEAKRFLKAESSTVEGYEQIIDKREEFFRDRYGKGWGTSEVSRSRFFRGISSKYYHRLHDMGVSSELLIRYATVVSEYTKSKSPRAVEDAFKRLYEKVLFADSEITSPQLYAQELINKRTKTMTARGGKRASIYDVYTKYWYDGGGDDETDVEL
ncbi:MAG: hypothetical protein J6T77_02675 [Clostridia bacterium]|nr:hypothetical protein [Clostridia bacterium]